MSALALATSLGVDIKVLPAFLTATNSVCFNKIDRHLGRIAGPDHCQPIRTVLLLRTAEQTDRHTPHRFARVDLKCAALIFRHVDEALLPEVLLGVVGQCPAPSALFFANMYALLDGRC